ncbi:MAG TPA: hypothetical protein VFG19_01255 [Geobacteraceae bacterium]|nr:hypothetical protein [Geobacteraceae bacterium]
MTNRLRKNKIINYLLFSIFFMPIFCYATSYQPLGEYQVKWCIENGGAVDYINLDGKKNIACIIEPYVIDVVYANQWKEAIGQALYYGAVTGKNPGVALIMQNSTEDKKHLESLRLVADRYNIKIWEIR